MLRQGMEALRNIEEAKEKQGSKAHNSTEHADVSRALTAYASGISSSQHLGDGRSARVCNGSREGREIKIKYEKVQESKAVKPPKNGKENEKPSSGQNRINTLVEIVPEGVKALEETQEWEEIEMAVDSGASDHIFPTSYYTPNH